MADSIENELINADDFKSIELAIAIMNTTTRTEIRNGQRIFGNSTQQAEGDLSIRLVELLDREMVLDVPANACAEGHNLLVHVSSDAPPRSTIATGEAATPAQPVQFSATAKVRLVEIPAPGRNTITLSLIQYDEDSWKTFIGLFSNRQAEIEAFFNAVKGS